MFINESPSLMPIKMCSSQVELDQFDSGWTLAEVTSEDDSDDEPRVYTSKVVFDDAF